jgi:hypothetical protein
LFSLSSSFDGAYQSGPFLIQRNRDKCSTQKFEVGVFTQPGPEADMVSWIGKVRLLTNVVSLHHNSREQQNKRVDDVRWSDEVD